MKKKAPKSPKKERPVHTPAAPTPTPTPKPLTDHAFVTRLVRELNEVSVAIGQAKRHPRNRFNVKTLQRARVGIGQIRRQLLATERT